jgi:putative ABC transport system substrate-binding protein
MTRRGVIVGAAAAFLTMRRLGAQTPRRARIGYLSGGSAGALENLVSLVTGLRELGWRIGDTLELDERYADGDAARLPRLAADLVALGADVLVATGVTETLALRAATTTVPIIFTMIAEPVAAGVVQRIARPGGNITGFSGGPQLLHGKQLDLLTQMIGRPPRRLAWVRNPGNAGSERYWTDVRDAALRIGADVVRIEIRSADDVEPAFAAIADRDAAIVNYDFQLYLLRSRIAELATRLSLPVMYGNRVHVLAGGLMSYGPDFRHNFRQAAAYVDRILNGTRPNDLPVVEASRFELVINLAAARALGLTVVDTLLVQADEVIE